MAAKAKAEVEEVVEPTRVQLLSVEHHPIDGRKERWQMSDGSVLDVLLTPEFVEK